jgi:hypothetical protein
VGPRAGTDVTEKIIFFIKQRITFPNTDLNILSHEKQNRPVFITFGQLCEKQVFFLMWCSVKASLWSTGSYIKLRTWHQYGPGKRSWYCDSLRAGLSPVIESQWERDFPLTTQDLGPTQPPVQWVPGLSPGVQRPGRSVASPPSPLLGLRLKKE